MAEWKDLRIDMSRLKSDIETLSKIGRSPEGALGRHAFEPPYEEARAWLKGRVAEAGIEGRDDPAGNTFGRVGPKDGPCVMSGSHIDTVPDGGPLDGAFGVLSALEVARSLKDSGLDLPFGFECAAFVEEEGRFLDCMGSKAMAGQLDLEEVAHATDPHGKKLTDAMKGAGFDPARIAEAQRPKGDVKAYIEIHIEQGPVLEQAKLSIGVVEAIVGINHTRVIFEGEPDHAGTTPMDLRKDAFTGAAEYAYRMRQTVLAEGTKDRARITFGIVDLLPGAANIVPYEVSMMQEIRDVSDDKVDMLYAKGEALAREIAEKHKLGMRYEYQSRNLAAAMDLDIQAHIREAAKLLDLPFVDMPSGAGHDAQVVARVAPAGMIFVPSKGGRSHRRDEWTDWPYLEKGANVLLQSVLRLLHA